MSSALTSDTKQRFRVNAGGDIQDQALPNLTIMLFPSKTCGYPSRAEYAAHICALLNAGVERPARAAVADLLQQIQNVDGASQISTTCAENVLLSTAILSHACGCNTGYPKE